MDFESSLTLELKSIPELQNRVYPLSAPEKTPSPYIVYLSSEGTKSKSVSDGYLEGKLVGCEINVIAAKYSVLKEVTRRVVDLLISMERRVIGNKGPFVQELTYETPIELYEAEPNLYRCVIEIKVYF